MSLPRKQNQTGSQFSQGCNGQVYHIIDSQSIKKKVDQQGRMERLVISYSRDMIYWLKLAPITEIGQYFLRYYSIKQHFNEGYYEIIMEKCDTSLFKLFKQFRAGAQENIQQKISIMLQLIKGLSILHNLGYIHGDLKPDNIMLKGNNIKFVDYQNMINIETTYTSQMGNIVYSNLQKFKDLSRYYQDRTPIKYEIYALAIIIQEMFDNAYPITQQLNEQGNTKGIQDPLVVHLHRVRVVQTPKRNYCEQERQNKIVRIIKLMYRGVQLKDICEKQDYKDLQREIISSNYKYQTTKEYKQRILINSQKKLKDISNKLFKSKSVNSSVSFLYKNDKNHDGQIDYEEFKKMLSEFKLEDEEIMELFNHLDTNHSHKIDMKGQFKKMLKYCYKQAQIKDIIEKFENKTELVIYNSKVKDKNVAK